MDGSTTDMKKNVNETIPALFLASFLLLAVPVPYVTPSIITEAPKGSLGFSEKIIRHRLNALNKHH